MRKTTPMNEAWKLLKGDPKFQANLAGTRQVQTGGTMPNVFAPQSMKGGLSDIGSRAPPRAAMDRTPRGLRNTPKDHYHNTQSHFYPQRQVRPEVGYDERSIETGNSPTAGDTSYMRDLTRREQRQQRRAQRRPQEPRSAFEPMPEFSQRLAEMNRE